MENPVERSEVIKSGDPVVTAYSKNSSSYRVSQRVMRVRTINVSELPYVYAVKSIKSEVNISSEESAKALAIAALLRAWGERYILQFTKSDVVNSKAVWEDYKRGAVPYISDPSRWRVMRVRTINVSELPYVYAVKSMKSGDPVVTAYSKNSSSYRVSQQDIEWWRTKCLWSTDGVNWKRFEFLE